MDTDSYESLAKRLDNILKESKQFQRECQKHRLASKNNIKNASNIINKLQNETEKGMVLLEERIVIKQEALSLLELTCRGKEDGHMDSINRSMIAEKEVISDFQQQLGKIDISEDNLPLLKLREKFRDLSCLSREDI